jgi:hypothetical protein
MSMSAGNVTKGLKFCSLSMKMKTIFAALSVRQKNLRSYYLFLAAQVLANLLMPAVAP